MTQKVMDQCNHSITFTFQHSPTIIKQDSLMKKTKTCTISDSMKKKHITFSSNHMETKKFQ
jgi:hypothetical protein